MKRLLLGYILGILTLVGCAAVQYKFYGLEIHDRTITQADVGKSLADLAYTSGMLLGKLGKDGWPDLPFSECRPSEAVKGRCIHMVEGEFFNMSRDLDECHTALNDAQRELQACQSGLNKP